MRCEIEAASPADAPSLAHLVARALPEAWSESTLHSALEQGICRAVAARDGAGGVRGLVLGRRVLEEVQIALFAVDPSWQGQGLGRRLLRDFLARARREGATTATLEVRPSNGAARALYDDFGFALLGRRPHYYADGEDTLLLGAEL